MDNFGPWFNCFLLLVSIPKICTFDTISDTFKDLNITSENYDCFTYIYGVPPGLIKGVLEDLKTVLGHTSELTINGSLDGALIISSTNSILAICYEFQGDSSTDHEDLPQSIFFGLCWVISVVFLSLNLYAHYGSKEKFKHFTKLQLSFTFSLLTSNICYLVSTTTSHVKYKFLCESIAVVLHYIYLSSFFWMNTLCQDLWSVIRRGARNTHRGRSRFIWCSLYAWGLPLVIVGLANLNTRLKQENLYDSEICWIVSEVSSTDHFYQLMIYKYFYAIVTLLSLVNAYFYGSIIFYLWKTKRLQKELQIENDTINLVLFLKLMAWFLAEWIFTFYAQLQKETGLFYFYFLSSAVQAFYMYQTLGEPKLGYIEKLKQYSFKVKKKLSDYVESTNSEPSR